MKKFWFILAAFLGLVVTAVPASADVTLTLSDGSGIGGGTGNYGSVVATQKGVAGSQYIEVTVTLLTSERFVSTGGHDGIAFNLNGNPTISSITVVSSNSSKFTVQPLGGSYDDDPFHGPYSYAISANGPGASQATENTIVFDIKAAGDLLLTPTLFGKSGQVFAVDIAYNCRSQTNPTRKCVASGSAPTGAIAALPEPGTWTMSIAGLAGFAGLVMLQRRRKQVRA